jgi:hypothetical protein
LIRLAGDIPWREAGKIPDRRAFRRGKKHRLNRHERAVAKLSGAFAVEVIALKAVRDRDDRVFYARHRRT